MKGLLVLRHAKSSWDQPGLADHDRPLNKRGRRAATRMGQLIADEGIAPELVLSSTSARTRETVARVLEAAEADVEVRWLEELYHAHAATYLEVLADVPPAIERVMVVGHNPGMEDLVSGLAAAYVRYPTAALANVRLHIDAWTEAPGVDASRATVENVWLPRELE